MNTARIVCAVSLMLWLSHAALGQSAKTVQTRKGENPLQINTRDTHEPAATDNLQPFTVADSVAMTHITEPQEEYAEDPPQVAPDGRRFLVVTERGVLASNVRRYSLLVFDIDELQRAPKMVAEFDSSSNRPGILQARWVDSSHISFIGEGPKEVPQIYIVDCRTNRKRNVTEDAWGIVAYAMSVDQRKAVYVAHWPGNEAEIQFKELHGFAVTDETLEDLVDGHWRRNEDVFQIYVKDLVSGRVQTAHEYPFWYNPDFFHLWMSPDGQYVVIQQDAPSLPSLWADYDAEPIKERVREFSGHTYKVTPFTLHQLMLLNTETAESKPLINAPCGSPTAVWSDSHTVVVADNYLPLDIKDGEDRRRRQAHSAVASVDIVSGAVTPIIEIGDDVVLRVRPTSKPNSFVLTGWNTAGGAVADAISALAPRQFQRDYGKWQEEPYLSETEPGSNIKIRQSLEQWPVLVKADQPGSRESVIFDPNPQFKRFRFGLRETIHWNGKRGESLEGGLVYPVNFLLGNKYPLVIQTHGFSPAMFLLDGPYTTVMAAEELANKGVFVLQLGVGPLYASARGTADYGPVNLSMMESAVDFLDKRGLIDRNAVGLVGFSVTGFWVHYALTHSSYQFAVATSAEGNTWSYWSYIATLNDPAWAAQNEAPYGGPPWNGNWKPWLQDSISFNYDKVHTPLRLESDGNDYAQVLNEWETFVALKRLHKPVELIFVCHGDHPVVKPWDRMTSQQGNVDWLLFWLKGEVNVDPSKAEQYARWRELKKLYDADKARSTLGAYSDGKAAMINSTPPDTGKP
jgi:dipeptidyl aminopeptidase/acylaminoacyl peptidase